MVHIQKGINKINISDLVIHLGVVCSTGIVVPEEDVVNPRRYQTLCVHQRTNRLQHSLMFEDSIHK